MAFLVVFAIVLHTGVDVASASDTIPAKPSATQAKWLDYEVGAVIHFNMQTFNRSMKQGDVAPPDSFFPRDLSTDQWVSAAASFGAKYVVLTLDHFSGFLLWPSSSYGYSVKNTTWRQGKADIAWEFIESCKKHDMQHGYFYSAHNNWFMDVENYRTRKPSEESRYHRVVIEQMNELFGPESKYKQPFYIWFDAGIVKGVSPDIGPIIRRLAPNSICDECPTFAGNQGLRWVGNEQAEASLPNWYPVSTGGCSLKTDNGLIVQGTPTGGQFCPASCDTVIREHIWFWENGTESKVKTPQRLVEQYLTSVGRGCTLILNINPDDRGLVPDPDLEAYRAFGKGVKLLYQDPLLVIHRPVLALNTPSTWKCRFKVTNGSFVLMEDIKRHGQLVKNYSIYYILDSGLPVRDNGTTIGHKRIHPFPKELEGQKVVELEVIITKLITDSRYIQLRKIAVYDWSKAVKEGYLDEFQVLV